MLNEKEEIEWTYEIHTQYLQCYSAFIDREHKINKTVNEMKYHYSRCSKWLVDCRGEETKECARLIKKEMDKVIEEYIK